jgi:hypothetical protein
MVAAAIRLNGPQFGGEGGIDATTVLRTEGVAFRGDTALVWVIKSTTDPSAVGFTCWSTDQEYRFIPERRPSMRARSAWRRAGDDRMRLSDGTCGENGVTAPPH